MDLQEEARLERELEEKQHFRKQLESLFIFLPRPQLFSCNSQRGGKGSSRRTSLFAPSRKARSNFVHTNSQGARAHMHPRLGLWEQSPGQTPGDDSSSCKFCPASPGGSVLPIRMDAKANPVQTGFELRARLGSRRAQLPKATAQPALRMDRD